jgi:hypothetical protein
VSGFTEIVCWVDNEDVFHWAEQSTQEGEKTQFFSKLEIFECSTALRKAIKESLLKDN